MNKEKATPKASHYGGQGFTLVELMVAMTIMVVVTAVGMVSFTGINKRSRDGRRVSDLKKVAMALEIYRQEVGNYPASLPLLVDDYLDSVPTDPKSFSYDYSRPSLYTYTYEAQMEDLGSTNMASVSGCGDVCNYVIHNP